MMLLHRCKPLLMPPSKAFQAILPLVGIAYPFVILFGLRHFPAYALGALLVLIIVARHIWTDRKKTIFENAVFAAGLVTVGGLILIDDALALLMYPLIMNLGFAAIFTHSILYPPSIIEKIARLHEPNLNEKGVMYTRRVTQVWIGFFIVNGGISACIALSRDMQLWTLYNGFISYVLMGVLFAGEFIIRQFKKSNHIGSS